MKFNLIFLLVVLCFARIMPARINLRQDILLADSGADAESLDAGATDSTVTVADESDNADVVDAVVVTPTDDAAATDAAATDVVVTDTTAENTDAAATDVVVTDTTAENTDAAATDAAATDAAATDATAEVTEGDAEANVTTTDENVTVEVTIPNSEIESVECNCDEEVKSRLTSIEAKLDALATLLAEHNKASQDKELTGNVTLNLEDTTPATEIDAGAVTDIEAEPVVEDNTADVVVTDAAATDAAATDAAATDAAATDEATVENVDATIETTPEGEVDVNIDNAPENADVTVEAETPTDTDTDTTVA